MSRVVFFFSAIADFNRVECVQKNNAQWCVFECENRFAVGRRQRSRCNSIIQSRST